MNQKRLVVLLVFCFAVAFGVVHLESQKVRYARQIARLNNRMLELDYQRWQGQLKLAKLCSPAELRERSEKLALGIMAPSYIVRTSGESGEELAGRASGPR